MTQDPATRTSGRHPSAPDASGYSLEDLAKVVAMAAKERRRFELDPRGFVEPQVRTKLHQLNHQGLVRNGEQEQQARLFFARYYQEKGGIENPRLLSNQERADLVQGFQTAELPARVALMKDLEAEFRDDWPAAFGEFAEGLPLPERPAARRLLARFEHHRLHSVDPAVGLSIDAYAGALDPASPEPEVEELGVAPPGGAGRPPGASDGEALPGLAPASGLTDDWTGPGLDAGRAAALTGLLGEVLAAPPDELPALEARVRAAFADDPFTMQRVLRLARARFGQGISPLAQVREIQAQGAEAELRRLRDRLAQGWDYKARRREDRAAFATLEAASGLRLRLTEDGRIAIGEPGEAPLAVVGWPLARALARDPEEIRDRFALIDRLLGSPESDAALRNEIDRTLGLIAVDEGGEPSDYEARRQAILAARAALRAGHDPAALRVGLIAVVFPGIEAEPFAWGELLLDLLPIIGEIRSAAAAVESFDAMAEALARGDLEEAAAQGLLGALATAGAVPALGPLFKTLRTLTVRALRSRAGAAVLRETPVVKGVAARRIVARSRDSLRTFAERIKPAEIFGDVWPGLTANQQSLLRGLLPHLKGKPIEKDLERLLDNAGMKLQATQLPVSGSAIGRRAILDAVSRNGFSDGLRVLTNSFVFPTRGAKGTIFEFKLGDTPLSQGQEAVRRAVKEGQEAGGTPLRLGGVSIVDFEVLRIGFDEIPEDVLESEARRLLGNHVNGVKSRRLTQADADALLDQFLTWHRDLRKRTAGEVATLGEAFLALGLAASARAARHGLEAEEDAPDDP